MSEPPGDRPIPPVIFSPDGKPPPSGRTPDPADVTKIVIGQLPENEEAAETPALTMDEIDFDIDLEGDLAKQFPKLTHLHLWRIGGLKTLGKLPLGLKCLDVRYCGELEAVTELPSEAMDTLVLENNDALNRVPVGKRFDQLTDLSFRNSAGLEEDTLNGWLNAAPRIEKFDASGCTRLTFIGSWPPGLADIRLDGCRNFTHRPNQWSESLRRLQLRETALTDLPDFPDTLDYIDLGGMRKLNQLPGKWGSPRTLFLFESGVLMPPASEHGGGADENVAERTRAYFDDVALTGEGTVKRCKLLILGNGLAGKTCLSLNLTGGDPRRTCKDYEPKEDRLGTTHGVEFHDWEIPAKVGAGAEKVHLHLWDFGGQEIYHNTHRLFMSKGTVFVVVWNPDQHGRQPERHGSHQDRWHKLSYWLDYIHLACPHQPRIAIVCAGKTETTPELQSLLENEIGKEQAGKYPVYFIDSLEKKGETGEFNGWLRDNVGEVIASQGTVVPSYWEIAQDLVENWVARFKTDPDFAAEHQQLRAEQFGERLDAEIRRQAGDAPDRFPKLRRAVEDGVFAMDGDRTRRTLGFLSHSGWIYWDPNLFEGRAIIGQEWALDGIYTILERVDEDDQSLIYLQLERKEGQFTRENLERWGWKDTVPDPTDQALLISFMERIGLCFRLNRLQEQWQKPAIYVSLNHLPPCPLLEWRSSLARFETDPDATGRSVVHPRLHRGHWDLLLSAFGEKFGTSGRYARDGFYFENRDDQAGLVTIEFEPESDGDAGAAGGKIEIGVRGPGAAKTEEELATFISGAIEGAVSRRDSARPEPGNAGGEPAHVIQVFVSYTWDPWDWKSEPNYEAPVNAICEALEKEPVRVFRDKNDISSTARDSITRFMEKITETHWVIIVHSDKFWRSEYCLWEMWALLQSYKSRNENFRDNLILIEYDSSGIRSSKTLAQIVSDWEEKDDMPTRMQALNPSVTDIEDLKTQVIPLLKKDIPQILARDGMYRRWEADKTDEIVGWIKEVIGLDNLSPDSPA